MQKIRNIFFVAIVVVVVFCCLGNKFAGSVLHVVDIPDRSVLEGRVYQKSPEFNAETLSSGTFQDELEQYIADLLPKRDIILLTNAAAQRVGISSASALFGFDTMPTFYGSDYYISKSQNSVFEKPASRESYSKEKLNTAADAYSKLIANNPDVTWTICMPDRPASSVENPAYSLSSNVADYKWFEDELINRVEDATIVDGALPADGTLSENRYNTDHHWRIQSAVKTYQDIMESLGRECVEIEGYEKVTESIFYGSASRTGLCLLDGDEMHDAIYDRGDVKARAGESKVENASITGEKYKKSSKYANMYAEYFHSDYAMLRYHNPNGTGKMLIIGDSYTNSMDRFFASSYEDVHVFDARYYNGTVQDVIDREDYDDVVILMSCTNIASDAQVKALK